MKRLDMEAIGDRICFYRRRAKLTQEELATKISCTSQHVSAMERGVKTPKLVTFVAIADALNVPADMLLQDVLE